MAKDNLLSATYVEELLAYSLVRRSVFDVVRQYLKFSYLQHEEQKKLWQYLLKRYDLTGRVPTVGQMQQQFMEDDRVLEEIAQINEIEVNEEETDEELLDTFENFIRKMKFLEVNDKIADTYNRGDREGAWNLFVKSAEDFSKFSIAGAKFEKVFDDFAVRQARRQSEDWNFRFKVPTGIDELDYRLGGDSGGPETGELVLWLGDSGAGKSQCLVWLGISAARQGHRVAHFQLEGTKEQCLNRYDAAWTGTLYQDVKMGNIPPKKLTVVKRIIEKLRRSDIIVSSEESFNAKTLVDVRRELQEMERGYGKIDVVIIDYLELMELGDGHNYSPGEERFRQSKLMKGLKMLAMEMNVVVHTATQASNIPEDLKQDPEFVITRQYLNEDKGKIRPADIFITINQTRDEANDEIMRLHTDKLRDYRNGNPIHICNNFSHARFYDRKRTMSYNLEDTWDEIYDQKKEDRDDD